VGVLAENSSSTSRETSPAIEPLQAKAIIQPYSKTGEISRFARKDRFLIANSLVSYMTCIVEYKP